MIQTIQTKSDLIVIAEEITQDFLLYDYQQEIFEAIESVDRTCVIASRQIGKSETLLRFGLAWAAFHENQLVLIVSAGERQANEVLRRIKNIINSSSYESKLYKESATEIELAHNNSRILSLPNSPNTVRGYPANLLLVDETDSIENWDDFVAALWPSVSRTNGKIVCSGTYKGKRQLYNLTKDPAWKTLIFPYTVNPPLDIQQQKHDLPAARFAEEFECIPVDASATLFPLETIDKCVDKNLANGNPVTKGALYFGGYDPAKLADPSIVQVLELLPNDYRLRLVQTKDYSGLDYSVQAKEIEGLHQQYFFHSFAIDKTGVGEGAFEQVKLYLGSRVNGVNFSRLFKEQIINDLRIAFQDKLIIIPDDRILIRELHDLDPSTLDHKSSGTSDRVWALALAYSQAKQTLNNVVRIASFDFTDTGLVITTGFDQGKETTFDQLLDFGFITLTDGLFTIARIWADKATNKRHIVECWQGRTTPQEALEKAYQLHKKRSFTVIGIEENLLDQIEQVYISVEENHKEEKDPLPLHKAEIPARQDLPAWLSANLDSPISIQAVTASIFIQNKHYWPSVINPNSENLSARLTIAAALNLASNPL